MLIAVPSSEGIVGGPGEGDEILIFDSDRNYELTESYRNPGLDVLSAKGIRMLVSALQKKVTAVIVAHVGSPTYYYIKGKIKMYVGEGMKVIEAINRLKDGLLPEFIDSMLGERSLSKAR